MKIGKKLKVLRKERKLTLKELAEKSGVQIATLSRMERDIMTGTFRSHINICKALGVSLSDFYRDVEHEHKTVSLIKQRHPSFAHPRKSTIEMLATQVADKKMMPLLIRIRKGGHTHKEENKPGTEKFIYVLEGKICAKIGKEEYNLSKGDSIYFDASSLHALHNIGKNESRAISLLCPPAV
ncbi:MAG: helix-turn-helix transcriptional regulator [Candidatus Omnitrophota bacterium]|nr:MAG: helix-turn-helix transcriptional regulator [Candidatus Omnitrophota bacterium]